MPYFRIVAEERLISPEVQHQIGAVMLFPDDPGLSNHLKVWESIEELRSGNLALTPDEAANLLEKAVLAPSFSEKDAGKRAFQGAVAGQLLKQLLIYEDVKLEEAYEWFTDAEFSIGSYLRSERISTRTLQTLWAKFRPVSHLWLARAAILHFKRELDHEELIPCHRYEVSRLLSIAASIFSHAELRKIKKDGKIEPLLSRDECWLAPQNVALPSTPAFDLTSLAAIPEASS